MYSTRRGLVLVALLAAVAVAGCLSMEERMRRADEGGTFSKGLQAVLMVNQTTVTRGRPLVLHFAIKNGDANEVRIAEDITRDSGWAGLLVIGPDGAKPAYQDVLIEKTYLRVKETKLLRTGDVHVVQWMLTGEQTRALQPGYHSLRGVYVGVKNSNHACSGWWEGRLESNAKFIRVQ